MSLNSIDDKYKYLENPFTNPEMPKNANEENQYRILSFPWCIAGKLLSTMKFLN